MRDIPGDRLFANELEFVHWLAKPMEENPSFYRITLELLLNRPGAPQERVARADIMAARKTSRQAETLIVECKKRPIYGSMIDQTIAQLSRYGALQVRAANIELWDLDELRRIFRAAAGGARTLAS
ncbi:hypothetical protein [Rhizobium laguerreae]|uniref:hypothetical protein n=1 Tax=Rhizobium laguerreae TaxID=1076926 RepID=UPI001C90D664|nr:hypothetical protein [Rhizobium laguerreae]MBY3227384.1 hypothetical protein [Rhizobium laguerreae]